MRYMFYDLIMMNIWYSYGLYNHEMIVYIVVCIWYMFCFYYKNRIRYEFWNSCRRFAEICIKCPIYANGMCFLTGNELLDKTDRIAIIDSSVRRLTPFSAWKRRFIVFRIWFWFSDFCGIWYGITWLDNMTCYLIVTWAWWMVMALRPIGYRFFVYGLVSKYDLHVVIPCND